MVNPFFQSINNQGQPREHANPEPFSSVPPGFGTQIPSGPMSTQSEEGQQNPGQYNLIDDLTFTLTELNKAIENIQVISTSIKDFDVVSLIKGVSGSDFQSLIKSIDLNQISAILESPLVRQMLTDPEFLSLLSPDSPSEEK